MSTCTPQRLLPIHPQGMSALASPASSWPPPSCCKRPKAATAAFLLVKELKEVDYVVWKLRGLVRSQKGQGMVEYALILVLVSIVVIVILLTMGNQIRNVFSDVVCSLGASCRVPD